MRKLILLLVCALAGVAAVQGQSYYAESYKQNSGKLLSKLWMAYDKSRMETKSEDGQPMIAIYRKDSANVYCIFPEKKMYMVMAKSQLNLNGITGMELEARRNVTKEFIKNETVEGYPCKKYKVTFVSVLKDGREEKHVQYDWIYDPLKAIIMTAKGYDEPEVLRNIKEGPQPEHLFEIPKGYKQMPVAGQLGEMLKSSLSTPKADGVKKDIKDTEDALKSIKNDPDKSQNEKTMDMLKMLNDMQKKKK